MLSLPLFKFESIGKKWGFKFGSLNFAPMHTAEAHIKVSPSFPDVAAADGTGTEWYTEVVL